MTKPDTSERAKMLAFGQGERTAAPQEAEIPAAELGEPRIVVEIRENTHVLRQYAPGEVDNDPNQDIYSAKMKQLIEAGIVRVDAETQHVDWPEGTPPLGVQPADVVDTHETPAKKAPTKKAPAKKAPAKKAPTKKAPAKK